VFEPTGRESEMSKLLRLAGATALVFTALPGSAGALTIGTLRSRSRAEARRLLLVAALVAAALAASVGLGLTSAQREGPDAAKRAQLGLDAVPKAARGPVSRALGRGDRAYHVRHTLHGLAATNRPQRLEASFTSAGVQVHSGRARLGLAAHGLGYGDARRTVAWAPPRADANRVAYRRGALVEWYGNGPLGLEQGFMLRSRPAPPRRGPLTVELRLSGNLSASLERGRHAVTLRGSGASLRYTGLIASDARGRTLRSWLELRGRRLLVRVDDRRARYPLQIDPFIQQAKLTASDGLPGDFLGFSVAVAGDRVVVGAPLDDLGADFNQGSAYVFAKGASGWPSATEIAKLTASDAAPGDRLGSSVAISGDEVVAGAPLDDVGANADQGSAYVFEKPASGWANATETAKLAASDGAAGDFLGFSVAVAGDTVVAGADRDHVGANAFQGSAYVFQKPAAGWASATETAKLTASDGGLDDGLGFSVAAAGDTVVAGAHGDDVGANLEQGSVYVFEKPVAGWASATETAKLTSSDGAPGDELGRSVTVSGDTVVAGAPFNRVGANALQGSAYVYQRPSTGWASATETAKLTASDGTPGDQLGFSVAVSSDTVVAGTPSDGVGANPQQGSAYVFQKAAAGWASATETAKLTSSDGAASDRFGFSVAVSGDTVLAGALGDNAAQGSAYVFVNITNQPPSCSGVSASPGELSPANHAMKLISLAGATDPDGDPLSYHIDGVSQDEPVTAPGDDTTPDAQLTAAGASSNQALVRAERNPQLNGRVYRIAYMVTDGKGGSCSRTAGVGGNTNAKVAVRRQKNQAAVDDGNTNSWNSFTGTQVFGTLP
jgi:FG-GAP repeat protein